MLPSFLLPLLHRLTVLSGGEQVPLPATQQADVTQEKEEEEGAAAMRTVLLRFHNMISQFEQLISRKSFCCRFLRGFIISASNNIDYQVICLYVKSFPMTVFYATLFSGERGSDGGPGLQASGAGS